MEVFESGALHSRGPLPASQGWTTVKRGIEVTARENQTGVEEGLEEKEVALRKLGEVEERIKRLDMDVATIREQARAEAEAETERIKAATEAEVTKLRQQAQREIESAAKAARQELRQFAAAESARLAQEAIQRDIGREDDQRIIAANIEQLGRSN